MSKCPRNNSLQFFHRLISHHGKSLSTSSLPIGEYCSIVSFKNWLHYIKSNILINFILLRLNAVNMIKSKCLCVFLVVEIVQDYLVQFFIHINALFKLLLLLLPTKRSASNNDFNSFGWHNLIKFQTKIFNVKSLFQIYNSVEKVILKIKKH